MRETEQLRRDQMSPSSALKSFVSIYTLGSEATMPGLVVPTVFSYRKLSAPVFFMLRRLSRASFNRTWQGRLNSCLYGSDFNSLR